MKVRTLADLPPIAPDPAPGRYGGVGEADASRATGFFRTLRIDGRWWLIDPEGRRFIHQGVASVRAIPTRGAREAMERNFGTQEEWARKTSGLLRRHGFTPAEIHHIHRTGRTHPGDLRTDHRSEAVLRTGK